MKKSWLLLAFVLTAVSCKPQTRQHPANPVVSSRPGEQAVRGDFAKMAKYVMPAVVHIYTLRENPMPSFLGMMITKNSFLEALKTWVHGFYVTNYSTVGTGSGFIIDKRGYILTNNHVIADGDKILVKTADLNEAGEEAEKLGADPISDVALIKIRGSYMYETLKMGDSDSADVGEWVAAIGNPFDVGESFTLGVVSGLGRDDVGMLELEDFIQTDAAINPGNSGGPLVNEKGEVIGINAVIFNNAVNIGFAVPINIAKNILPKLVNGERIDRGMIGVTLSDLTPELSTRLGVPEGGGALVQSVRDDSPARKAGIRPGDVITSFNGKNVSSYLDVKKSAVSLLAGTKVAIGVVRDGKKLTINVKLARFERRT